MLEMIDFERNGLKLIPEKVKKLPNFIYTAVCFNFLKIFTVLFYLFTFRV